MEKKKCTKCGEEKELGEFHKSKNTSSGYKFTCKQCDSNRQKLEKASKRKERLKHFQENPKYCELCGKIIPINENALYAYTNKKYCSKLCSSRSAEIRLKEDEEKYRNKLQKHLEKEKAKRASKKIKGECKICKSVFVKRNEKHCYCSKECLSKSQAVRARKKKSAYYSKNPKKCLFCGEVIPYEEGKAGNFALREFCNYSCQSRNRRKTKLEDKSSSFKIEEMLRGRLKRKVQELKKKKNYSVGKIDNLIGCTLQEFKEYIESLFTEGMTWDNHGVRGWHLDHVRPVSCYQIEFLDEAKKCFHYTNLQPLWADDNLRKSNKIGKEWGNDHFLENGDTNQ